MSASLSGCAPNSVDVVASGSGTCPVCLEPIEDERYVRVHRSRAGAADRAGEPSRPEPAVHLACLVEASLLGYQVADEPSVLER